LEAHLAQGEGFVAGPVFTLADIAMGLSVHRWLLTPFDKKIALPAVMDYYERLKGRKAGKDWMGAGTP
jgi:glutathione S-transferase